MHRRNRRPTLAKRIVYRMRQLLSTGQISESASQCYGHDAFSLFPRVHQVGTKQFSRAGHMAFQDGSQDCPVLLDGLPRALGPLGPTRGIRVEKGHRGVAVGDRQSPVARRFDECFVKTPVGLYRAELVVVRDEPFQQVTSLSHPPEMLGVFRPAWQRNSIALLSRAKRTVITS